ncbi:stemmadenine O-acetyltransferase-like [Euphorbia lathyris]|uniref:stemmadenine O-acetyltransferase-like n=1 Tax=Euphorbia lathyris TaxID=212925 RepID=UPI0033134A04
MEVSVLSVEIIRPSSSHVHHLKPFNFCLLDQLIPNTYTPFIFFYNTKNIHLKTTQITSQLKWSLSNTLNLYYPLSGRVKDNLIIDKFDAGVPCFEARVNGHLSDFLRHPGIEMLNRFLPYQNFYGQLDPTIPQLAVQVNVFDCGGIALGLCFAHKIMDGITTSAFMKTWAANSSGSYKNVIQPNIMEASSMFPPQKSLPSRYTSLMDGIWFGERRCKTRRFMFDANAVAALRTKGRSEFVENPTRVQALSAFIWKSTMNACNRISGSSLGPSVMIQSVNIRRLTKPRMSRYSMGNLVLQSYARYNPDGREMEMKQLVSLLKESVGKINSEYVKTMIGDEGCAAILRDTDELVETSRENNPHVFTCASWNSLGSSEIDFGWGGPVWVGVFGEMSSNSNDVILIDMGRRRSNAFEAWITLEETTMDVLQHDPEFLAFANSSENIVI